MTAVTTAGSSPSPQFSSLPPELRSQIWREVLSEKPPPAFFFYKKGCWQPRFISETDEDYDSEHFFGVVMKYRHEFLDRVEVELPLFFVNSEARGIALAWMSERDIEIRFRGGTSPPIFIRYFDPLRDALYVPVDRHDEFCCEPIYRAFEPDMVGQNYCQGGREIPNIAIPEELFWTIRAVLEDGISGWFCPAKLYIVVNAHVDLSSNDDDDGGKQQQWGFDSIRERALIWNFDLRRFEWDDGEHICDQDLYRRIEEVANKDFAEMLFSETIRSFEVRPVMVVVRS